MSAAYQPHGEGKSGCVQSVSLGHEGVYRFRIGTLEPTHTLPVLFFDIRIVHQMGSVNEVEIGLEEPAVHGDLLSRQKHALLR